MKLKEKLARELADKTWPAQEDDPETWDCVINSHFQIGFIAGFEKARELIAKEIYDRHQRLGGLGILDIGEEEVE